MSTHVCCESYNNYTMLNVKLDPRQHRVERIYRMVRLSSMGLVPKEEPDKKEEVPVPTEDARPPMRPGLPALPGIPDHTPSLPADLPSLPDSSAEEEEEEVPVPVERTPRREPKVRPTYRGVKMDPRYERVDYIRAQLRGTSGSKPVVMTMVKSHIPTMRYKRSTRGYEPSGFRRSTSIYPSHVTPTGYDKKPAKEEEEEESDGEANHSLFDVPGKGDDINGAPQDDTPWEEEEFEDTFTGEVFKQTREEYLAEIMKHRKEEEDEKRRMEKEDFEHKLSPAVTHNNSYRIIRHFHVDEHMDRSVLEQFRDIFEKLNRFVDRENDRNKYIQDEKNEVQHKLSIISECVKKYYATVFSRGLSAEQESEQSHSILSQIHEPFEYVSDRRLIEYALEGIPSQQHFMIRRIMKADNVLRFVGVYKRFTDVSHVIPNNYKVWVRQYPRMLLFFIKNISDDVSATTKALLLELLVISKLLPHYIGDLEEAMRVKRGVDKGTISYIVPKGKKVPKTPEPWKSKACEKVIDVHASIDGITKKLVYENESFKQGMQQCKQPFVLLRKQGRYEAMKNRVEPWSKNGYVTMHLTSTEYVHVIDNEFKPLTKKQRTQLGLQVN